MSPMPESVHVLLVEDNPIDARVILRAARNSGIANDISHVADGTAALAYLHQQSPFEDALAPDLVLLDLNLPGVDGRDVLAHMKNDEQLRCTPVVVLTTSDDDADILRSYELGANAFVTKPIDADGWAKVVSSIEGFWFQIVKLPGHL
jgi:two-component system, chemotaxis family, response regulator Rcp1